MVRNDFQSCQKPPREAHLVPSLSYPPGLQVPSSQGPPAGRLTRCWQTRPSGPRHTLLPTHPRLPRSCLSFPRLAPTAQPSCSWAFVGQPRVSEGGPVRQVEALDEPPLHPPPATCPEHSLPSRQLEWPRASAPGGWVWEGSEGAQPRPGGGPPGRRDAECACMGGRLE